MPNISMDKIKKCNAALHNGFTLDLWHGMVHGDNQAIKKIELEEGKYLQATIGWYNVAERWSRDVIYAPKLHLAIYVPTSTEGVFSSSGMGALIQLTKETFSRRNWNKLAAFTVAWTDEKLLEAMRENMGKLGDPVLHFGATA